MLIRLPAYRSIPLQASHLLRKNTMLRSILLTLTFSTFPLLLPAQTTQTFSNSTSSILDDAIGYDPNNYPSKIEVSGMPAHLHEFAVRFMLLTGSFPDIDLLLEAPNGQRILLTSDLPYPLFDSYDFGIGSTGKDTLSPATINDLRVFYPANYDDGAPDLFPSPGPGTVAQPAYPDPLALQDINPNGEWKLYLVDDTPNGSSTWLLDGWTLEITADDLPACKRPGKPNAFTQDFSATLGWAAGAGNSQWDLLVTPDLFLEPADSTTPTQPGLLQYQNVVVDSLEAGLNYAAFVRADCGGGRTSPWVGPAVFKTTLHPCDMATSVGLCQAVDYPTLPYYQNFFFNPGQKVWVFAFTPPDSGDYWMQFEGNSGNAPYYRLDNQNNCEDGQWTPMEQDFSEGLGYRMHNLVAGQTCWIIHHAFGVEHQIFRIERCPLRRMAVIGAQSFTDSLLVDLEPAQNLGNSLDLYFGVKPLSSPDENTAPTNTGQSLTYVPGGYDYVFRDLMPDTEYEFYVRRSCANGQASCWQGPFSGKTAAVCSTIKSVHVDTTTYTWADVTFSFDSIPLGWEMAVCLPGQNPSHNHVGLWEVGAQNDTMTVRLKSLPLTTPLQLYFKAHCLGQSWQGPYDIPAGATPPLPVHDLFCMEATNTIPETSNFGFDSYIDILQTSSCYGNRGEKMFRYRSNQTDTAAIVWYSGCNGCIDNGGCSFYYKSASELPDIQGWKLIGCWRYGDVQLGNGLPNLKFPVEKDSIYYLLCDGFSDIGIITSFPFALQGCTVTCPKVDSIALETISPTSAVLRWNAAAPGGYYELRYFPVSGAQPPVSVTTSDTALTLTGLLTAAPYTFQIRSFCSPTDPGGLCTVT
ncbi:MAG TPA: fibronectin type III domain-containing protein, partial [Saprospiraceae bacterium]|nr:fibronectin type III domain-containing protein [Saprospiraceae bacterium]